MWQDFRYALRLLGRNPLFTLMATLSLAIGIGANSAIFSVVDAVLLRPLPVADPRSLAVIYSGPPDSRYDPSSYPDFLDFQAQNHSFSGLVAHSPLLVSYTNGDRSEQILGEIATADYFQVLGIPISRGRGFVAEEDQGPGAHPVVVVSDSFWRRRLDAAPDAVGRLLKLDGHDFRIIGIAPASFRGLTVGVVTDLWVPISMADQVAADRPGVRTRRDRHWLQIMGRLRPGTRLPAAQTDLGLIASRLAAEYPDSNRGHGVAVLAASSVVVHPEADAAVFGAAGLLGLVVGAVLLIAAANVANLLLARASARRRDIAIRLAIGASRLQLIRQLLVESVLLALLGGGAGLLLAAWVLALLVRFRLPLPISVTLEIGISSHALVFTFGLALLTGVLCGLAPALVSSRPRLVAEIKDDVTAAGGRRRRFGLSNLLVIAQVAVSLLLLIGAGLFVRSLESAQSIDPGFRITDVALATAQPAVTGYDETRVRAFYHELARRAAALPGVQAVAMTDWVPLTLGFKTKKIAVEGSGGEPMVGTAGGTGPGAGVEVDSAVVEPGYFKALAIALLRGRDFNETDRATSPRVAVIDETMASHMWRGRDPLGARFRLVAGPAGWVSVVGVVRDSKVRSLGEAPRPYFYLPFAQSYSPSMTLLLVTAGAPEAVLPAVRREVAALDPNVPIAEATTLAQHLQLSLFPARVAALLLGLFGLVGLLLAAVGLYGVVSQSVARRTREMGIRLALGSQRGELLAKLTMEGMVLVGIGVGIGLAAAYASSQVLASLLFGISAVDPLTFTGVPLMLLLVALLATLVPAWRAMRIDPVKSLRAGQ